MHREASTPSLNSFAKGVLGISPPISSVRTMLDELEAGREEETTRKVSEMVVLRLGGEGYNKFPRGKMVVKGKPSPDVIQTLRFRYIHFRLKLTETNGTASQGQRHSFMPECRIVPASVRQVSARFCTSSFMEWVCQIQMYTMTVSPSFNGVHSSAKSRHG